MRYYGRDHKGLCRRADDSSEVAEAGESGDHHLSSTALLNLRIMEGRDGFDVPAFESMLARIQATSSTGELSSDAEPQSENTAKSLLNDFFLKAIS